MRLSIVFAVAVSLPFVAGPSLALAPCPPSCHLGQGQPIYLSDVDQLLVTRCDRKSPPGPGTKKNASWTAQCTTERLDLEGKVLEKLPVPHVMGGDMEFEHKYLDGHTLVQLNQQEGWAKLDKPYGTNILFSGQQLILSLEGRKLTCLAPGYRVVEHDFGCVPYEVRIFASSALDKTPRRPVVIAGVCRPKGDPNGIREVLVTCLAKERANPAK